ncbi:MAG: ParB/RepB/Spo0J family partition protein [Phycisphaerae bacterium]
MRLISIADIKPNPLQPRSEFGEPALEALAASIRASGILQPVLARPVATGGFELVAGERRWRAAQRAGLAHIPAIVRVVSDHESLELALIENLQREDLGPLERARAYQQYIESFRCTADELAGRISESRANVTNYLRLLRLPAEIQDMLRAGALGMGHARAIAALADPARQLAIARLASRRGLAVRQVEALAKREGEERASDREAVHGARADGDRHLASVEESLSRALGVPVRLVVGRGKNRGKVIITYRSLEEFDRISERLTGRSSLD